MEKLRTLRSLLLSDRHPCPEHDRLCPNHRKVSGGLPPTRRSLFGELVINPVRNSSGALNPAGINLKCNPAAPSGPEGLWPGGSSGALFLTGEKGIGFPGGEKEMQRLS